MVRSVGIVAVVVGLAWTGLAGAQSSSPLEKARYINVSEEGKPPQRCKLLKTWHEANGTPAFQVQAVDTGELMTIVGTAPQGAAGDPREMKTRIFHWGRDNKSPAGAPVPPPTATARITPTAQPVPVQNLPKMASQTIRPSPVATTPRPTPVPLTAQKLNPAPVPTPVQPVVAPTILTGSRPASSAPTILTSSKPASSAVSAKPIPVVTSKTQSLTPMGTQVIQYSPTTTATPVNQLPAVPKATDSQSRLTPLAAGSIGNQKPCNCCPSPCDACCKPCNPCGQSSCVCNTPSPMRQPLIGRLLKSNKASPSTTVVSQPPPKPAETPAAISPTTLTAANTTTGPTQPNDWRQSWGNVEPFKGSTPTGTVKAIEVSRRVDPKPVAMEPSSQPDPLKNPDQYRDLVMSSRLANSNIPQVNHSPSHPAAEAMVEHMPPNAGVRQGQMVEVSADEPNAFWSPKSPDAGKAKEKLNPFSRQPAMPPQNVPPSIAGVPPSLPRVPPDIPGVAIAMMPPHAPGLNMPTPPLPATAAQRGPMTMAPQAGVPGALGNAFTLSATSRPIPADFGGTPQEPNGFDPPTRVGQGMPPQGYGMGMPGNYRPQMSNMVAMGSQAVNPLMSVPPSYANGQPVVSTTESTHSGSVPQLLVALKDSLRPSERESAAEQLSELNWRMQPLVVESLMNAARQDPAPTVRAACVHALAHMKVATPAALSLVRELKSDGDANVRQEAEEALNALSNSGIQQASHK